MTNRKDIKKLIRKQPRALADQPPRRRQKPRQKPRELNPYDPRAKTEVMRTGNCPFFANGGIVMEHDSVRWVDELRNEAPTLRKGGSWLRAANSFCFIKPNGDMATCKEAAFLVTWAAPLSGGARRVCRALSGYFPPAENLTDDNHAGPVWRMQTEVVVAHVSFVYPTRLQVLGFDREVNVAQTTDWTALYVLENPHPDYQQLWDASRRGYAAAGNKLTDWADVAIKGPRPAWYNAWSWQMLRMEEGYPARHPNDPANRADLRSVAEKRMYRASRADAESADPYEAEVDEVGYSNASSIELDDDAELPTGRKWHDGDPVAWIATGGRRRSPTIRQSQPATPRPPSVRPTPVAPSRDPMPELPPLPPSNATTGATNPLAHAPGENETTSLGGPSSSTLGGPTNTGNANPGSPAIPNAPSGEQQPPAPERSTPSRNPFSLPDVSGTAT